MIKLPGARFDWPVLLGMAQLDSAWPGWSELREEPANKPAARCRSNCSIALPTMIYGRADRSSHGSSSTGSSQPAIQLQGSRAANKSAAQKRQPLLLLSLLLMVAGSRQRNRCQVAAVGGWQCLEMDTMALIVGPDWPPLAWPIICPAGLLFAPLNR